MNTNTMARVFYFVIIFHLVAVHNLMANDQHRNLTERVSFGVPAKPNEFPWMVRLVVAFGRRPLGNCGGTLIHSRWVLTAAHCVQRTGSGKYDNATLVKMYFGKHDLLDRKEPGELWSVTRWRRNNIVIHPNYTHHNFQFDAALIRVRKRLPERNSIIAPISLPSQHDCSQAFYDKQATIIDGCLVGTATGWGSTESSYGSLILQKALFGMAPFTLCEKTYDVTFSPSQLCAVGSVGADTCIGDSGGPLMCIKNGQSYFSLMGIISSGSSNCGSQNITYPGVYTRICGIISWIRAFSPEIPKPPVLTNKECSRNLPKVTNGHFTNGSFAIGSIRQLSCQPGFSNSGSTGISCLNSGLWSPPGRCELILHYCFRLPYIENGTISSGMSSIGSIRSIKCNPRFRIQHPYVITCNDNGTWSLPGKCNPITLTSSQCKLPSVTNGNLYGNDSNNTKLSPNNSLGIGSQIHLKCDVGYVIIGSNLAICRMNASWYPVIGGCAEIKCSSVLPQIRNGYIISGGVHLGRSRILRCYPGYNILGASRSTCQHNGQWSDLGYCIEILTTTTTRSCLVTEFRCENSKCIENYQLCDGNDDCGDRTDESICLEQHKNRTTPASPKRDRCFSANLPKEDHGFFRFSDQTDFSLGTTLFLNCNDGYRSHNGLVRCKQDGQWTRILGGNCYEERQATGYGQMTNLHLAARNGDIQEVRWLMQTPTDLTAKSDVNSYGRSPIHIASGYGHLDIVKLFLLADPSLQFDRDIHSGSLPVHVAAEGGQLDIVKYFISIGDDIETVDTTFGRTSLHKASSRNHLDVVKWLIERGANAESRSNDLDYSYYPIHLAANFGHISVVKYFIEEVSWTLAYSRDANGNIPMHVAALNGRVDVVSYFISERYVDMEIRSEKYGRTTLHKASSNGQLEVVKWLVSNSANESAQSNRYDDEDTPIHLAAYFGHLSVVKFFIETFPYLKNVTDRYGLNVQQKAEIGTQPGCKDVVAYLKSI